MKTKYKLILAILTVSIGLCLMTYQSYALWIAKFEGGENIVEVGCFATEFTELTSSLALRNTYPMSDAKGMSGESYQFTIKNTCSIDASYQITLNTLTTNTISKDKIKYAIYKGTENKPIEGIKVTNAQINADKENIIITNLEESYLIGEDNIKQNESVTYNFYLWIDNSAGNEVMGQTFEASIHVVSAATKIVPKATDYITDLMKTNVLDLAYDNTVDNNLRYIGVNPNNYITFNNELWRIIGVMNNIEDSQGVKKSHLKLIKDESIGEYSWDNKPSGTGSSKSPNGSNDWSDSALQLMLNAGPYYKRSNGTCPNGQNGATKACDFTTNGLTPEAKTMIESVKWKLGASSTYNDVTANMFYERERGATVYTGRPTEWIGQVGLMYPSDYGYATSGGATTNRESCLLKEIFRWNMSSVSDCKNNDWLLNDAKKHTLAPDASDSHYVFFVDNTGGASSYYADYLYGVYPVVYLKANTIIDGGNGTNEEPYILTMG